MRVRGISGLSPQAMRPTRALPGQRERSPPKHAVSEGLITLTEDKRPEANRIIELKPYALQRHSDVS